MKESTKKIMSFALASTIMAGVPVMAHAETNTNDTVIEEVKGEDLTYTLKCGDTLGKVSEMYFKTDAYYPEIARYNGIEDPNVVSEGQVIKIPRDLLELLKYTPEEETVVVENNCLPINDYSEDKTYTVKCGDTMDCIVRVQYGSESRELVDKLATYNGLCDPNRISVGQVLYIPCINKLKEVVANDYSCAYERMAEIQIAQARKECPYQRCTTFYPVCGVEYVPVYECTVEYVPVYDCNVHYVPVVPGCVQEYTGCPKLTLKP